MKNQAIAAMVAAAASCMSTIATIQLGPVSHIPIHLSSPEAILGMKGALRTRLTGRRRSLLEFPGAGIDESPPPVGIVADASPRPAMQVRPQRALA